MGVSGLFFAVLIAGILLAGETAHARNYERTRERRTVPYEVEVTTGKQDGAGTDANVFITVYGDKGISQEKKLSGKWYENNFEKEKVDKFQLQIMDVGKIQKITIRHDNGGFMPGWNLDKVRIVAPGGKEYIFPCNCLLQKGALSKDLFPEGDDVKPPGDCDGVFQDATHCWPFNVAESDSSPDLKGGSPAKLMDGAQVAESQIRGKVASTLQHNSWINLGDFKGRCISDPVKCPKGVTMMFWAKIEQSAVLHDPSLPKYVFSSGGGDQRSRGFSLFYMGGQFVVRVVAAQRKWKIVIENGVVPFGKWFSFSFTWTAADGLKYFINGAESGYKPQGELLAGTSGEEFNDFRISKDNNNNVVEKILALKIDQFATWARPLKADEISTAYQEGGKVPLIQPPADPQGCLPNPCQNGGTCVPEADNPEGYFCKCRPAFSGDKCEITDEQEPPQPTQAATTAAQTTRGPTTGGAVRNAPTTGGATTKAPTTGGPTTGGPTTGGPTTGGPTTGVSTPGASTTAAGGTTGKPTTNAGGSSVGPTQVPPTTGAPEPVPDMEQLKKELLQQINIFRRLHQSSDVAIKEELNQKATKWAQQLAASGVEKTDTNSTYGQLVCSHHTASDLAKACAVKWYGAIKFFDWAEPKLTVKASPFTQLVWKSSTQAGVGIAKKGGAMRRGITQGKYFIVIFLEPGQSDEQDIKQNVQPAGAITQPAPGATCPEGYSKVQYGNSRSCFAVRNTSVSWDDALLGCALENGTLASLDCREEADLVVNLLTQSNVSEAWIGLHDSLTEGRYVWVDGSPIPFSEWLPEEPDGNEAENCIVQAKGKFGPGWADKHCFDTKAFVCEVPLPGYTFYKLTFNLTEQQAQSYQNQGQYSQSYQYNCGSYCTYCTPAVQNVNDLLRETITRYFQAKNMFVQPVVNTVRCMPNGRSVVEVTLRLGPEDNSNVIVTLQTSIKENDGELELSNGASAKLVSVEILKPGSSYCPNQCASTTCQVGCDPGCCTPAVGQYSPQVSTRPEPIYSTGHTSPWQCPLACTRNVNYCPPYCSENCCNKRRSALKLHNF